MFSFTEVKDDGDDDDDDDVILNEVAPVKIVVDDDDDDEEVATEANFNSQPVVIKKEKNLEYDDGFMDVGEIVSLQGVGQVKIKSEPVDDGKFFRFHLNENAIKMRIFSTF